MNLIFPSFSRSAIRLVFWAVLLTPCVGFGFVRTLMTEGTTELGYSFVPDPLVSGRTYTIILTVHGTPGDTNSDGVIDQVDFRKMANDTGLSSMADLNPFVIVLAPIFGNNFYQNADTAYVNQVEKMRAQITAGGIQTHPKMFVHGFSAGAQFVHRYAMRFPDRVFAVSAHSAGSWATPTSNPAINQNARHLPFLVSCGEADTSRIGGARTFVSTVRASPFFYKVTFLTWPGVGHSLAGSTVTPTVVQDDLGLRKSVSSQVNGTIASVRWFLEQSDPDGDGVPLLAEQVLGRNPFAIESTGLPFCDILDGRLRMNFDRHTRLASIILTVEGANSLNGPWSQVAKTDSGGVFRPIAPGATVQEPTGTPTSVTVTDPADSSTSTRFLRLRVGR